jgi:hypothetical protein
MPLAEAGNHTEPPISERTVWTYLKEDGYGQYVAKKVVFLTDAQKKARRDYGRMYRDEELDLWERRIFSDECYVYLGNKSGRIYITRRKDEAYEKDCCIPVFKQSSLRVMVWGCIGLGWKGPLVVLEYSGGKGGGMTAARYREQVLEAYLKDICDELMEEKGDIEFQHDGAPSHRAKVTQKWLKENGIKVNVPSSFFTRPQSNRICVE